MRSCEINRKTNETDIALTLNLDGTGSSEIKTDCGNSAFADISPFSCLGNRGVALAEIKSFFVCKDY